MSALKRARRLKIMASESIASSSDVHLLSEDDLAVSSGKSAGVGEAMLAAGAAPEIVPAAAESVGSRAAGAPAGGDGDEPSHHVLRSSAEIAAAAMIPLHTPEPDPLLKSHDSGETAKPERASRSPQDEKTSLYRNDIERRLKNEERAIEAARLVEETGDHPARDVEPNVIDHPIPDLETDDRAAAHSLFHSESGSNEICPADHQPTSATGIAAVLGFNPESGVRAKPRKPATSPGSTSTSNSGSGSFDDLDAAPRGSHWPGVLLISYASAMTFACIWLVIKLRHHDPMVDPSPAPIDTRPDPGLRASHSRKVDAPPAIPPGNRIELGRTLKIGSLEFTPIELVETSVKLWREGIDGSNEERAGGESALALKVRVRNISPDLIFAPLDEAFVRDRDHALPDGYLENDRGERIYLYPLAVQSEWSIEGENFRDLKPGETMESNIYTVEFGAAQFQSPTTWRIRLRTGIDRTEIVGVVVRPSDLKPATNRAEKVESGLETGADGGADKTNASDPNIDKLEPSPRDRLDNPREI